MEKTLAESKKDETNRMSGRKPHKCRICGAEGNFETYLVREMMQGTKDEFVYFVCDKCQCLQIADIPENLEDYYGSDYYSFQLPENPDVEFPTPVTHNEKILDVGCGAGIWLFHMAMNGWGNLYGCDPFLERARHYGDRVTIRKCSIHEMEGEGTFDYIRMSDSFEHMTDPLEVLKSVCRLLKPEGELQISIPSYPNIAFDRYGTHWYQLDAPRHIFLHSRKSLEVLSKASGLAISEIIYDSNNDQFVRSFLYQRGIPYFEQKDELVRQYFSDYELRKLQEEAEEWNKKGRGDHMEVRWTKAEHSYMAELSAGITAKQEVFDAFLHKLTVMQWEEWSGEILDILAESLKGNLYEQQRKRIPYLLARISVPSIIEWVKHSKEKRSEEVNACLLRYAMEVSAEVSALNSSGGNGGEESSAEGNSMEGSRGMREYSVQELCFCAWLLREAYTDRRTSVVEDSTENVVGSSTGNIGMEEILFGYVAAMGAFAARYYNREQLTDDNSFAVSPDIRAIYRMSVVLADKRADGENVAMLKEALKIFPPFHEEILCILMKLKG